MEPRLRESGIKLITSFAVFQENKRKKRRRLRRKRGMGADCAEGANSGDDSSGFHSGSSSENGDTAVDGGNLATAASASGTIHK